MNYEETFSPVISTSALRSLFAIAAMKNYVTMTFDIKTAFLYGILDEDVYMYPPDGYNNKDKVFKLKKALYGLKQAPLKWNIRFTTFLKRKGFKSLESEQCLFTKNNSELILGIYVDDGILMGKNQQEMKQIIKELKSEFKMTVENKPKTFVGFEIIKEERDIKLLQADYITKILKQYNMNNAKPVKIPLLKREGNETELKNKNYPYREVVGSLLYLSTKTRPDIAYGVNFCSRHVENYTQENINDVKHILKYLKGHTEQGITFLNNGKTNLLEAYCDSDYAGDQETRRSTTGYVIYYAGGPISWCSRRQSIIALSSTEAEYVAAAECCKELLYLKTLIQELTGEVISIELNIDNQSAMILMTNGVVNRRSKHIDVKYRFVHDLVKNNIIKLKYCPTNDQIADILTKPLNVEKFGNCKKKLLCEPAHN